MNHECNEDGIVYESNDGHRFYFKSSEEAKAWYEKTEKHITMGSVCCSICGSALIDQHIKL